LPLWISWGEKMKSVGVHSTNLEPDDLIQWLPDGIVSGMSSCWSDGQEMLPLIDVKVSVGGETLQLVLNEDAARDLSEMFLGLANDAAEQAKAANKEIYDHG